METLWDPRSLALSSVPPEITSPLFGASTLCCVGGDLPSSACRMRTQRKTGHRGTQSVQWSPNILWSLSGHRAGSQVWRYGEAEVKAELANFCSGLRLVGIHVVDQGLNTPQ